MIKSIKNVLFMAAMLFGVATISNAAYYDSQNSSTSAYTIQAIYDQSLNVIDLSGASWTFEAVYDPIVGGYAVMTITDVNNNVYYVGYSVTQEDYVYQWSEYALYYYGMADPNDPFLNWYMAIWFT